MNKDEKAKFFKLLEKLRKDASRLRKPPPLPNREVKERAYYMVRSYLAMKTECPDAFADRLRLEGLTEKEWTDNWFRPLGSMGIRYPDLIDAVERGMTLDDLR